MQRISTNLALYQRYILLHASKLSPPELQLVYDNIEADSSGLSEIVRDLRYKRFQENGKVAAGFMALSIGGVVGVGGVPLPTYSAVDTTHSAAHSTATSITTTTSTCSKIRQCQNGGGDLYCLPPLPVAFARIPHLGFVVFLLQPRGGSAGSKKSAERVLA
jgi:hypothetical protein